MNAPQRENPFIAKDQFAIEHDSDYIRFEYWSTIIAFKENHPIESNREQKTVFLKSFSQHSTVIEGIANTVYSIKNNSNFPALHFYIYSRKAGKTVFKLPELPNTKSIKLEFKKEGIYELHFFLAGSRSFSKTLFEITPQSQTPPQNNFAWNLKLPWQFT
ncbi:MAG: hypothetical protein VW455_00980 [Nitrospinota bacterium]